MQVPVATTGKLSSTLWETCDFIGNAGGMNLFLFFTAPCAVHSLLCSSTKDNGQRILLDLEDRDWLTHMLWPFESQEGKENSALTDQQVNGMGNKNG